MFITEKIKKKCTDTVLKETKLQRQSFRLLDALPKLKELKEIKAELKNTKTSIAIVLKNCFGYLSI